MSDWRQEEYEMDLEMEREAKLTTLRTHVAKLEKEVTSQTELMKALAGKLDEYKVELEQERIISSYVLRVLEKASEYHKAWVKDIHKETHRCQQELFKALAKLDKPIHRCAMCHDTGTNRWDGKPCNWCKDKPTCEYCEDTGEYPQTTIKLGKPNEAPTMVKEVVPCIECDAKVDKPIKDLDKSTCATCDDTGRKVTVYKNSGNPEMKKEGYMGKSTVSEPCPDCTCPKCGGSGEYWHDDGLELDSHSQMYTCDCQGGDKP